MKNIIYIFAFFLCISNVVGQTVLPDKSARIDKKLRTKHQQTINTIDATLLHCDTLHYKPIEKYAPFFLLESVCYDMSGQLRKYLWKESCDDGAHESLMILVYYDENGDLIYIKVKSGNSCSDAEESYYVNKGYIIDFKAEFGCDCCDDGDMFAKGDIEKIRPAVGNVLSSTIAWNISLTNFMRADALLSILNSEEYDGNGWQKLSYFEQMTNGGVD